MKTLKVLIQITSVRAKVDGSLGLGLCTPELSSDEKVAFMELLNANVNATFQPIDEPKAEEINIKKDINSKSQSERIRAIIYILYKQDKSDLTFENYYKNQTEKIIDWLKLKIINWKNEDGLWKN